MGIYALIESFCELGSNRWRYLQVRWPNQRRQSSQESSGKAKSFMAHCSPGQIAFTHSYIFLSVQQLLKM